MNYPIDEVAEAWRNVLLYSEHTWGAWNSVSDSENTFVTEQWRVKRQFAVTADKLAHELVRRALPEAETDAQANVDVHNTTSWPRTEVIRVSKQLSAAGDRVTNERGGSVPSQRLTTGELAIFVRDVPPFGAERFRITRGEPHFEGTPVTVQDGVLDNGLLHVRIDRTTGNIVELFAKGHPANVIDVSGGSGANEFLFLEDSDVSQLQRSGSASIIVEEKGPLVAAVRIESDAPGCNRLTRTLRLAAGTDYLEIVNLVDKKRAPLNPNPGKGGPGDAFAQRGSKESIQFGFPFLIKEGQVRVEMPFSVVRPEADQLPGACKNWLPVSRWADVSNSEYGVTWITLDAPLMEIGEISANLLGSQRDPSKWRKHILPTQKIYSWVMNNHWGTNYRAYQEGPVVFRYALKPHGSFQAAAAARLAIGLSQLLIATRASASTLPAAPFLNIEPKDVLVTAMKPSDDGKACIVRLFGASGQNRQVTLKWSYQPRALWRSDLSEHPAEPIRGPVQLDAWELLTIRAEFA